MLVGFEKLQLTMTTFAFSWISLDLLLFAAGQTGFEGNFEYHDNRTVPNCRDFADSTVPYNTS